MLTRTLDNTSGTNAMNFSISMWEELATTSQCTRAAPRSLSLSNIPMSAGYPASDTSLEKKRYLRSKKSCIKDLARLSYASAV